MTINRKLLVAEIILLLASVFIFRSLWLILDTVSFMHKIPALWASLILGIGAAIPALRFIIRRG